MSNVISTIKSDQSEELQLFMSDLNSMPQTLTKDQYTTMDKRITSLLLRKLVDPQSGKIIVNEIRVRAGVIKSDLKSNDEKVTSSKDGDQKLLSPKGNVNLGSLSVGSGGDGMANENTNDREDSGFWGDDSQDDYSNINNRYRNKKDKSDEDRKKEKNQQIKPFPTQTRGKVDGDKDSSVKQSAKIDEKINKIQSTEIKNEVKVDNSSLTNLVNEMKVKDEGNSKKVHYNIDYGQELIRKKNINDIQSNVRSERYNVIVKEIKESKLVNCGNHDNEIKLLASVMSRKKLSEAYGPFVMSCIESIGFSDFEDKVRTLENMLKQFIDV